MKSPHSRTDFFAALVLLVVFQTAALGQLKTGDPVVAPPTPTRTPTDIPFGIQRSVETGPIQWREFKSEAGGFSVKLPGEPRLGQVPFNMGPISFKLYTHAVGFGDLFQFEVDYADFPAGYNNPDLSLEGGINGLTREPLQQGATLLSKGAITRGTCEGREATLALPRRANGKQGFRQGRIFNSGQRYFFLVFTAMEDGAATRETAQAFMDSFVVADGCRAAIAPTVEPPARKTVTFVEGTPDAATGWRKIEDAELGFQILMPGAAEHESELAQVEPIPLTHHTFSHEDDTSIYTAEVIGDYPPNFHSTPNSYDALADVTLYAVRKRLEPVGFVLATPRNLRLGPYPGRDISMSNEKIEAQGRMQIYVTPKRVYVFIAFVRGKNGTVANIERFFSSIRVSPK
jgi:hypothetical protein